MIKRTFLLLKGLALILGFFPYNFLTFPLYIPYYIITGRNPIRIFSVYIDLAFNYSIELGFDSFYSLALNERLYYTPIKPFYRALLPDE